MPPAGMTGGRLAPGSGAPGRPTRCCERRPARTGNTSVGGRDGAGRRDGGGGSPEGSLEEDAVQTGKPLDGGRRKQGVGRLALPSTGPASEARGKGGGCGVTRSSYGRGTMQPGRGTCVQHPGKSGWSPGSRVQTGDDGQEGVGAGAEAASWENLPRHPGRPQGEADFKACLCPNTRSRGTHALLLSR